jgi:hypothetical protein
MEFWNGQLELAQRRVAELQERLWLQQQEVQHFHAQGGDPGLHLRLHLRLVVMEQSLARAKAHALYVERRIWVRKREGQTGVGGRSYTDPHGARCQP